MNEQLVDLRLALLPLSLAQLLELVTHRLRLPPEAAARGWQLLRPPCPGHVARLVRLARLINGGAAVRAALLDDFAEDAVGSVDGVTRNLGEILISNA